MQHTLCPSCDGWQTHPEDRLCGNCGEVLLKANIDIIPAVVYQDIAPPDTIGLLVTKQHGNLDGTDFIWRRVGDNRTIPISDITFTPAPHDDMPVDIDFPLEKLTTNPRREEEWQLIHRIMNDCEPVLGRLTIGTKIPELALTDADILLEGRQNIVELHLANKKGSCFNISELFITSIDDTTSYLPNIDDDLRGATLCEGEELAIPLLLPSILIRQLHGLPAGLSFKLNIKSLDIPQAVAIPINSDFRVRVPKPPKLEIIIENPNVQALQNGKVNLSIYIENIGGEVCIIEEGFNLEIMTQDEPITIHLDRKPITLGIEESSEILLQTTLEDFDLPTNKYRMHISAVVDKKVEHSPALCHLEIIKPKPYKGIVVIDFGTTASAAAFYLPDADDDDDDDKMPAIISLTDDRKADYIPTAIAYYLNEKNELLYCIGDKALAKLCDVTLPENKLCFLDNLKWQLKKTKSILLPDGSEKKWWQVTADYLCAIKQRIENHPSIMAIIEDVYITQPARFDAQRSSLLRSAYKAAGMRPMRLNSGSKNIKTISESWPASMLSLQDREMIMWQQRYLKAISPCKEKYLWLNFDMGGGSTDLSLMTIDIDGYDHMRLEEIASDGDNHIAGNFISSLLYKHITLIDSTNKTKINLAHYPITLSWENNVQEQNNKRLGILNGREVFENVIFPLQQFDANEQGIVDEAYAIFINEADEVRKNLTQLWLDETLMAKKSVEPVIHNFSETLNYHVKENPLLKLSVVLKSIHGVKNEFDVEFSTKNFITDFITQVSVPLYNRIEKLLNVIPNDNEGRKLFFMVTGRGSMSPFFYYGAYQAYQDALKAKMAEHATFGTEMMLRIGAKTIVSEGACYIAHLLRQIIGLNDIHFKPLPDPSFGYLTGRDPDTGKYTFQALADGIISPDDGWLTTKFKVHSGRHNLSIVFCQKISNEEIFAPKKADRYNIQGTINFSAEDAGNTHLLVRMLDNGKLEASFAVPPKKDSEDEQDTTNNDYEHWERQVLGTYQLLPNTKKMD